MEGGVLNGTTFGIDIFSLKMILLLMKNRFKIVYCEVFHDIGALRWCQKE